MTFIKINEVGPRDGLQNEKVIIPTATKIALTSKEKFMGFSTTHLIIFLVIIIVIFGTKKLRNIGTDLGGAVRGFKEGLKDSAEKPDDAPQAGGRTIESRAEEKSKG